LKAARIAELEARLGEPSKTPDNSSLPPSKGQKPNKPETGKRIGPRQGSLGRKGGGRPLACDPDETVTAKAVACAHCQSALTDADQVLHGRYDKIDLLAVRPMVSETLCRTVLRRRHPGGDTHRPGRRLAVQREYRGAGDFTCASPTRSATAVGRSCC
jgi:hypothetical protein